MNPPVSQTMVPRGIPRLWNPATETPPPCRGGGPQGRRGLPCTCCHCHSAWGTNGSLRPSAWGTNGGTVPNHEDLTTDEYSFVIKCPAFRHLPVRRKTPPPCRGGGSKSRRGFPPTYHSAWETKGSLRPSAWRTKRPLWPPHGEQKGRYAPWA